MGADRTMYRDSLILGTTKRAASGRAGRNQWGLCEQRGVHRRLRRTAGTVVAIAEADW